MTSVKQWTTSPRCPLIQLCYVRLAVQIPQPAAAFATEVLGLQHVPNDLEPFLYRSDERYYSLCFPRDADRPSIGIEISDEQEFDRIAQDLASGGFRGREATKDECAQRFVRRALIVEDATGNEIDLVLRPARSGRRYFPSRDAGVTGLQGVGLRSRAIKDDLKLWTTILGARITDRVGEITYLGIDQMHHRVALYPSDRAGLVYVSYGVESLDALMQNHYFAEERQIRILHGPGREPASGQMFVRFAGPEGYVFSYGHGLRDIEPTHRPRQFTLEASSLCEWGSQCADIVELQPGAGH
ncbi:VOC family protein [Bradyrhizobium jicamae]|uniref:VOC family protein n=1 Tax=Bradyrhizobium jicamae TaxID=280332 RepID=A0ABS5FEU1_9BRAD|nr:VOC family protein [Bradyrhizobium jicamae]MBR0795308.1 VOC family protein [Bradyrhizobium jicamae]MBR0932730.1 VOC family protein [Bradyrhizobium jicamae]